MRGLKPRSKPPPLLTSTPITPSRTLVFKSASSREMADDMAPATQTLHDAFKFEQPNLVSNEPLFDDDFLVHEEPPALPVLPTDFHDSSDDEPLDVDDLEPVDDEEDDQFEDLPEDPGSPIHSFTRFWPRSENQEAVIISMTPMKAKLIDIPALAGTKRRYSEESDYVESTRPDKRWAHSRHHSTFSATSSSPSPSTRSKSLDSDRDGSIDASTPATSVHGHSDDECESRSSTYAPPSPTFLDLDPAPPPRNPRRAKTLSKSFSKSFLEEKDSAKTGAYPSPPITPVRESHEIAAQATLSSLLDRSRATVPKPLDVPTSKRKSISQLFAPNQNIKIS